MPVYPRRRVVGDHPIAALAVICAGIAFGAAVVVAWLLPARARQPAPNPTDQPEPRRRMTVDV
jgi:hypothetical protein